MEEGRRSFRYFIFDLLEEKGRKQIGKGRKKIGLESEKDITVGHLNKMSVELQRAER